jgi:transposase/DNA invertase Pin-like site-specific DNA recombinase
MLIDPARRSAKANQDEDWESSEVSDQSLADALAGRQESSDAWIEALLFNVETAKQIPQKRAAIGAKRFAVYARFSRSTQKQSSIERQNDNCVYYLEMIGGTAIEFFADRGKSGATARHRSGLTTMLDRMNEFDGIVFEDFDRFSRELYDAVEIFERLEKAGVELHSAIDERALTKQDAIQAAARAEHDRIRRRNLTSAGLSQLVRAGGIPSGACYGYRDSGVPGFPIINDEEADVVRKIMSLASNGMRFARIAKQLGEDGDPSPAGSRRWGGSGVGAIVRRPLYTGRVFYRRYVSIKDRKSEKVELFLNLRDRIEKNYNERYRIVSDELFAAANQTERRKGRPKRAPAVDRTTHLFGNAVCDCPGVEKQRYWPHNKVEGRVVCNHATSRDSCFQQIHSLDIKPIESAIVRALRREASHSFNEHEFKAYYDERISEQLKSFDFRISRIESELHEAQVLRLRTFERDLREGWSGQVVVEARRSLEKSIADFESSLKRLSGARAAIADKAGRSVEISDAFAALEERLPFRIATESDAAFLAMFRKLVPEIRIERHGRLRGEITVVMKVVWDALVKDIDGDAGDNPSVMLSIDTNLGIKYGLNEAAQMTIGEQAAAGLHFLTDEQWLLVADHLPDMETTDHHGERDTSTRHVVNALVFKLATGVPISNLPSAFGGRNLIYNAILRFIYAGGVEKLTGLLRPSYPELVGAWDLKSVANYRRAEVVAAVPRVVQRPALLAEKSVRSGGHWLTDDQWSCVEVLIDERVMVPLGRMPCRIPPRTMLELILLKLRTRCAWRKVPIDGFTYNEFFATVHRMAYTGTWDRVVKVWGERFPELLAGVDVTVMPRARSTKIFVDQDHNITKVPEENLAQSVWDPQHKHEKIAVKNWIDLSDEEWNIVSEVLPPLSKRKHRRYVDGVLFVAATRTAWQKLPPRYGNWSSVFKFLKRATIRHEDGRCMLQAIIAVLEDKLPGTLLRMRQSTVPPSPAAKPIDRRLCRGRRGRPGSNMVGTVLPEEAGKPEVAVAPQLDLFGTGP